MTTNNNKELRVLICEDDINHLTDIKFYLDEFSRANNILISHTEVNFNNYHSELNRVHDLLILDYFDGDIEKGETVLSHNENNKKIQTVIYSAKLESNRISYFSLKEKYSCLIGYEPKLKTGDNLKNFILNYLFNHNLIEKNYNLYNDNDIFLLADIRSIGENYIKELIFKITKRLNPSSPFILRRMTSGLSGALVLQLKHGNIVNVLKISKEVDKLKQEHLNAKIKYKLFPTRLTIPIDEEEFESNDKKVFGILIKEVKDAKTLFSFIISAKNHTLIKKTLVDLFMDNFGLKGHYKNNEGQVANWSSVFHKIDKYKFTLIENAYEELKPLLENLPLSQISFIKNLVTNHQHLNLDLTKTNASLNRPLLLCHGDFHAKNILIQGTHPVIIDTGSIDYLNWSSDICRLIVYLFISGIGS